MKNPRAATKAAINRYENQALGMFLAIVATEAHPDVMEAIERRTQEHVLLKARLVRERKRKPRFRILWANLLTMVGASSLLAWLIVHALMNWRA